MGTVGGQNFTARFRPISRAGSDSSKHPRKRTGVPSFRSWPAWRRTGTRGPKKAPHDGFPVTPREDAPPPRLGEHGAHAGNRLKFTPGVHRAEISDVYRGHGPSSGEIARSGGALSFMAKSSTIRLPQEDALLSWRRCQYGFCQGGQPGTPLHGRLSPSPAFSPKKLICGVYRGHHGIRRTGTHPRAAEHFFSACRALSSGSSVGSKTHRLCPSKRTASRLRSDVDSM
jgi:hypothetical protein